MTTDLEKRIATALAADAARDRPSPDAWDRLQHRLCRPPRRRHLIPLLVAAAVVAVAAGTALVITLTKPDREPAEAAPPATSYPVASSPTPASTAGPNTGPVTTMVKVPDLVGLDLAEAEARLEAAGLAAVNRSAAETEPLEQVIAVEGAEPGDVVTEGTIITLIWSDFSLMTMPYLGQLTAAEAVALLMAAGWQGDESALVQEPQETLGSAEWGKVLAQEPQEGTTVPKDAAVSVVVGSVPTFPMPNLVGMTSSQARGELAGRGYRTSLITMHSAGEPPTPDQAGRVAQQSLPPEQVTPINAPITLLVYDEESSPPTTK